MEGETVTVAFSAEQFAWLKIAIANQRKVWELLDRMHRLSTAHMWESRPKTGHYNPLSKKKTGLN